MFFEATWARSQAQSHIEPFAPSSSDIYPATGWVPTVFEQEGQVLRNALVPENLQGDYAFTRRLSDIGARHVLAKRASLRLMLGLRGELSPAWSYEAYATHGQTPRGAAQQRLDLGGELRRESSDMAFDAVSQAGLNASNALPNTRGSFGVKELFVEARLPLLQSLPALQRLDALLAYRLSDYSTAGLNHSWNLGLDWAISPSLRARFGRAQSSRAPNIGELCQARMQNYPTVQDPCEGVRAGETMVLAQRCMAASSVRANMWPMAVCSH